jgi:chromosome partitioning protein
MKIFATVNQKGGAGKSTFAYNFAYYLSEVCNQSVFFGDSDSQGNSSSSLRQFQTDLAASSLFGQEALKLTGEPGKIVLARGDRSLERVEYMINEQEKVLANLKARLADIEDQFDWCIFDTPGSNSIVAGAIMHIADYALIPTEIDQYNLDVTVTMLKRVIALQKTRNPTLVNLGILANKFDARKPSQVRDLKTFLEQFNQYVIRAKLSNRQPYSDAAAEGVPVWRLKTTAAREAGKEMKETFAMIAEKMGVK